MLHRGFGAGGFQTRSSKTPPPISNLARTKLSQHPFLRRTVGGQHLPQQPRLAIPWGWGRQGGGGNLGEAPALQTLGLPNPSHFHISAPIKLSHAYQRPADHVGIDDVAAHNALTTLPLATLRRMRLASSAPCSESQDSGNRQYVAPVSNNGVHSGASSSELEA